MMNVVLLEPEMPSNTGNIGRTCVATNTRLHLIEPLGFKLNEKALKRAGLDYWDKLDVHVYSDYQDFLEKNPDALGKMYFATIKAHKVYSEVDYEPDCYLMFGKESAGIPEEILVENEDHCVRIPMWGEIRSLNLSNSVAVVLYEALRHNDFEKMALEGYCVLTPVYPVSENMERTKEQLINLKEAHFKRIELSDAILVVNINNYIGDSTNLEIDYAKKLGKKIIYYTDLIENK